MIDRLRRDLGRMEIVDIRHRGPGKVDVGCRVETGPEELTLGFTFETGDTPRITGIEADMRPPEEEATRPPRTYGVLTRLCAAGGSWTRRTPDGCSTTPRRPEVPRTDTWATFWATREALRA